MRVVLGNFYELSKMWLGDKIDDKKAAMHWVRGRLGLEFRRFAEPPPLRG